LFSPASPCHRALRSFPTRRSSDLVGRSSSAARYGRRCRPPARLSEESHRHRNRGGFRESADGGPILHPCATGACASVTSKPRSRDRKSTRLNSSHVKISYAVFCLK